MQITLMCIDDVENRIRWKLGLGQLGVEDKEGEETVGITVKMCV